MKEKRVKDKKTGQLYRDWNGSAGLLMYMTKQTNLKGKVITANGSGDHQTG